MARTNPNDLLDRPIHVLLSSSVKVMSGWTRLNWSAVVEGESEINAHTLNFFLDLTTTSHSSKMFCCVWPGRICWTGLDSVTGRKSERFLPLLSLFWI